MIEVKRKYTVVKIVGKNMKGGGIFRDSKLRSIGMLLNLYLELYEIYPLFINKNLFLFCKNL